jgi:outer membrane receptor protein involved in Fe transport
MYYTDAVTQVANLGLRPEEANTFEASAERRLTKNLTGVATVYHYRIVNLIEAATLASGWIQYQNAGSTTANGAEMELNGKFREKIEAVASVALQRAADPRVALFLPDSPGCVAKIRAAVPLLKNKLRVATALQYISPQRTYSYAQVPGYWLTDVTLTTRNLHPDFDLQFGARNLLNQTYFYPGSVGLIEDQIRANGRSVFLKLIWRTKE